MSAQFPSGTEFKLVAHIAGMEMVSEDTFATLDAARERAKYVAWTADCGVTVRSYHTGLRMLTEWHTESFTPDQYELDQERGG